VRARRPTSAEIRRWAAWAERRPWLLSCVALIIATGVSLIMARAAGFRAVGGALRKADPFWLAVLVAGRAGGYAGYTLAHRATLGRGDAHRIPGDTSLKLVAYGAAATSLAGGFATDHKAMRGAGASRRQATVRVLSLGSLEWITLAGAAWISALILLDARRVQSAVTIPWAVGVPLGFAIAAIAAPRLSAPVLAHKGGFRLAVSRGVETLNSLREQLHDPLPLLVACLGMVLYWSAEIVSLWAALRAFDIHVSAAVVTLGYATGHALTPRTLPLSGVGVTEALLPLALVWVGVPLVGAVPAVFAYRIALLALSIAPALLARRQVQELVARA
jgi:uncharacterized membrane protein YbhN (UPF0104 family)